MIVSLIARLCVEGPPPVFFITIVFSFWLQTH